MRPLGVASAKRGTRCGPPYEVVENGCLYLRSLDLVRTVEPAIDPVFARLGKATNHSRILDPSGPICAVEEEGRNPSASVSHDRI